MRTAIMEYAAYSKQNKRENWPKALLLVENLRKQMTKYNNAEENLRTVVKSRILSEYAVH